MLASITPLGERGRHARWWLTVTFFLLGASGAAVAAGALAGALGAVVLPVSGGYRARLAVLALALIAAIVLDATRRAAPGPRRQVDERWLDRYRGWVYGLGYGVQLGVGVSTVVTSAATYLALFAAFLGGGPGQGALIFGCYGLVRGLSPLAAAHVRSPAALFEAHARLGRLRGPARWCGQAVLGASLVAAVAGSLA